ncbi:MAG TPA: hypothetical protein VJ953_21705 [Saprospiraceae bacterium]|nr:hypothetical protein [Saprospiraceae bacterium]
MEDKNKFPDLSKAQVQSLEERDIKLNGQKVLFDKKVSLMPVELDKKINKKTGK